MNFPKVLALDHDPDALIALEHALESAGCQTTTTWHVAEALKLLNSGRFEVILLRRHPQIEADAIYRHCTQNSDCSLVVLDRLDDHERILHLLSRTATGRKDASSVSGLKGRRIAHS